MLKTAGCGNDTGRIYGLIYGSCIIIVKGVDLLADANITKRALASALRELMERQPFAKISVGDICEKCDMNRKSFYYHFKDKFDLVNWIFDTELITTTKQREYQNGWELLEEVCFYVNNNRAYYRKLFRLEGENAFSEYFREYIVSVISNDLKNVFWVERERDFYVDFYTDAFICALERWLLKRDNISASEFVPLLKQGLLQLSQKVVRDFTEKK